MKDKRTESLLIQLFYKFTIESKLFLVRLPFFYLFFIYISFLTLISALLSHIRNQPLSQQRYDHVILEEQYLRIHAKIAPMPPYKKYPNSLLVHLKPIHYTFLKIADTILNELPLHRLNSGHSFLYHYR